ncbi:MAG TPA: glycosyltransferase [Panacibacter sp.]|nr:glycosyltransferase [Panacibacter sp.]
MSSDLGKAIHKKRILIAPLDWGLGHATRCIPIIRLFLQAGHEVIIASGGEQLTLLKNEFPGIQTVFLKGYNISYARSKRWLVLKILLQVPKILLSIRSEHSWLKKTIDELNIDIVISDNRFGLYAKQIPSVFITHQLCIQAPYNWLQNFIQKVNYKFINRFNECWLPDYESGFNVSGDLAHPKKLPLTPLKYLGILSRFQMHEIVEVKYDYLAILSGPEPQRTLLEKKLLSIASQLNGNMLMLRGKPGSNEKISSPANCTVVNHLSVALMQQAFEQSEYIISRSGYTTVMEILSMQKKSLLIPTLGQTEQEYLARHLTEQGLCYCCNQDDDLIYHINRIHNYHYRFPVLAQSTLPQVVNDFLIRFL